MFDDGREITERLVFNVFCFTFDSWLFQICINHDFEIYSASRRRLFFFCSFKTARDLKNVKDRWVYNIHISHFTDEWYLRFLCVAVCACVCVILDTLIRSLREKLFSNRSFKLLVFCCCCNAVDLIAKNDWWTSASARRHADSIGRMLCVYVCMRSVSENDMGAHY